MEAKACEIWGSKENLEKELRRQEIERKQYQQCKDCVCGFVGLLILFFWVAIFTTKRRMRDFRREISKTAQSAVPESEVGLKGRSGKVVLIAVAM